MYGKNKISGPRRLVEGYMVNSLFYTIQGEGPWAGYPSIFLRFSNCNLGCFYCDTEFEKGSVYSLDELVEELLDASKTYKCKRIVITGGEPMLQEIGHIFVNSRIVKAGLMFQIETAGTVWPHSMEDVGRSDRPYAAVYMVCSPKTPGVHHKVINRADAWKYIIKAGEVDPDDGLPNMSTQIPGKPSRVYRAKYNIYVQPCDEDDEHKNSLNMDAAAASAMKYGYRLSLQLHKYLGLA